MTPVLEFPDARRRRAWLARTKRYAILCPLQTAKRPETRTRRVESVVEMLAEGRKIQP